jgi:hypothetical protein
MTQRTNNVALVAATWRDLGAGPMIVESLHNDGVQIVISSATPTGVIGHQLNGRKVFTTTLVEHVWVYSASAGTLVVTI